MKALSIKQPWAWLIVNGYKDIENRNRNTSVRGKIAVHASQSFDWGGYIFIKKVFPYVRMPKADEFPSGGFVGTVEIDGVATRSDSPWFSGPYGYVLKNPVKTEFIPGRGMPGFFETTEVC